MRGPADGLTGVVQRYLEHLDAGGRSPPREFLVAQGLEPDDEAVEILSLVAGPGAHGPGPGDRFGPYRIERELGRGAQGIVHLANDTRLNRPVALKLLAPHAAFGTALGAVLGEAGSRARVRAFEREAEAASRVDHAGICTVYEAGVERGVPFIAMRYVDGAPLAANAAPRTRAGVLAAAALVEKVARALHAAHEKGLVHRDIKPGNILLGRDGEPVLCDFGLARGEGGEWEKLTRTGEARGTPAYMSPEQLRAAEDQPLDRRTDVYSLGVVLYELLTGERPVRATSWEGNFREILAGKPPRPRRRNRAVGKDLEVVVATAMEKDRDRRYATALALAEDLRRVRGKEPIRARPAGPLLRLRRAAERSPGLALSSAVIVAALVAVPAYLAWNERRTNVVLRAGKERAEREQYEASISAAHASLQRFGVAEARRRLDACPPERRGWEWRYLRHASDGSTGRFSRSASVESVVRAGPGLMACAEFGGDVTLFDREGRIAGRVSPEPAHGQALACARGGELLAVDDRRYRVQLWNGRTGERIRVLRGHSSWVRALAFTPDASRLLSGSADGTVRIWDPASGRCEFVLDSHEGAALSLAPVPGTTLFVSGGRDGAVLVHDWAAGRTVRRLASFRGQVFELAAAADAVAVGLLEGQPVRIVGFPDGAVRASLFGHTGRVSGIAFSDGRVVTGSWDGSVRLWDAGSGRSLAVQAGHAGSVRSLAVDGEGTIWTGGEDRTVRSWSPAPRPAALVLRRDHGNLECVAFHPDGTRVAYGGWRGTVRVADLATREVTAVARGHADRVFSVAAHPGGELFATASRDGSVRVWRWTDGEEVRADSYGGVARSVAWSPDGALLASAHGDGTVRIRNGERVRAIPVDGASLHRIAFSPDGRRLAVSGHRVAILDVASGATVRTEEGAGGELHALAWCRSSGALAWGGPDGVVRLRAGGRVRKLAGHRGPVRDAAFGPGGRRLVTAGVDHTVRLWSVASGETLLVFREAGHLLHAVAFGPRGERIAAGGFDRCVRIWEAAAPPPVPPPSAAVRARVDALFREHRYSPFALDALDREGGLGAEERSRARRLILSREEDPEALVAAVHRSVRRAGDPDGSRDDALAAARAARRLAPHWRTARAAEAAALFRAGDPGAAAGILRAREADGAGTVESAAFLALAEAALGNGAAARSAMARMEARAGRSPVRPDLRPLVEEARAAARR